MAIPLCLTIPPLADPQQLTLPGGVTIEDINLMQIVQPALTPLVPLFDLVDAIVAMFNCVKAIPDALGPPPDPTALAASLPDLAKKVDKLLRLIPQVALPVLVLQLVDLVSDTVRDARAQLQRLEAQANQVVGVIQRATTLGDAGLMAIAHCAQANVAQEAANVGKSLAAMGKLIGIINLFLTMIGGPQLPAIASLSGQPLAGAIAALDALLTTLNTIRGLVPTP